MRPPTVPAKMLQAGTIKRIHVSQVDIRANRKDGGDRPVFTIQTSKGPLKARAVEIRGASEVIYRATRPLSCGARVWIETKAEVTYDEP